VRPGSYRFSLNEITLQKDAVGEAQDRIVGIGHTGYLITLSLQKFL